GQGGAVRGALRAPARREQRPARAACRRPQRRQAPARQARRRPRAARKPDRPASRLMHAMAETPKTVEVSLLGRTYRVACAEGEREALMQAVAYLDGKMNEIRKAGKVMGAERIAVMAALN